MTKGQRIKKLRERMGISQTDFADKINVSKQTLYKYENDVVTNIPSDKIENIAKVAHSTPAYIMGWEEEDPSLRHDNISPVEIRRYPMLGEIACGVPRYASEDRESYVVAGTDIRADFCLTAHGDSMINARICDGDIVFIRKQDMVDNGEIAAVEIGDEATLKRVYYYRDANLLILRAENPDYEDLTYQGEELDDVHILGKAVAFQSDVK